MSDELILNETDTCREYVIPNLQDAGWADEQIVPQYFFTDGRVQILGGTPRRLKRKFADYLLKYRRDTMLAVVEAKAEYKQPGDGLQQAKEYAEILGLPFAYATNGAGIVEFDYATGLVTALSCFPSPEDLWLRYQNQMGLTDAQAEMFLTPLELSKNPDIRYCLRIAINKAIEAIVKGDKRLLHYRDGDRQDHARLPGMLEAVAEPVESCRGAPSAEDPLPRRP